jgi:hypothetical protein
MLLGVRCVMKKWSASDPPPAHRGALLPVQPNHPGCRDEQKLDGYVVYEHQASSTEKTRPNSAD